PDGPGRPRPPGRTGREGRGRLREGEPALHRPGVAADPAHALLRERDPVAADEDRLRLLARRRRAVRLHGGGASDARANRPRRALSALWVSQQHAAAPERLEREGARRSVAPDLRGRRALRDQAAARRACDLVAAVQGLLVADVAEVRDPGLPPAGVL